MLALNVLWMARNIKIAEMDLTDFGLGIICLMARRNGNRGDPKNFEWRVGE